MSNEQQHDAPSVHDIERNGVRYIMEWNPARGTVSITEAMTCDCTDECPHDLTRCDCTDRCPECETLETYDYAASVRPR